MVASGMVASARQAGAVIGVGAVLQDRYEIVRHLASGGMSDVYAAHDRALDRPVAIKVVRGATPDLRQRLEREARLLARFEHPNLVRVYDAQHEGDETEGDDAYVVLEFVEGRTLAELIAAGPVAAERVALLGAEVADALAYIHARGVIHRDVKPSNVFVGADGRTRLSDFGVARHADDAQLTQTGMVIGTGAYMAPEQVRGDTVGPAADIYALGLVLLECLTATRAYAGPAAEAAMARLSRDPDVSSVPAGWASTLGSMTARDATSRPGAAQSASALRALALGAEVTGPDGTQVLPVAPTNVAPVPVGSPVHRRHRAALIAVGVAILALVMAIALVRRGEDTVSTDDTTTTVTTVRSTTTSTKPSTTTPRCAALQAQRDALDEQEKALADQLKGKALRDAQKNLETQKQSLDEQLKSCND